MVEIICWAYIEISSCSLVSISLSSDKSSEILDSMSKLFEEAGIVSDIFEYISSFLGSLIWLYQFQAKRESVFLSCWVNQILILFEEVEILRLSEMYQN